MGNTKKLMYLKLLKLLLNNTKYNQFLYFFLYFSTN